MPLIENEEPLATSRLSLFSKDPTRTRRGSFSEYLATGSSREQLRSVILLIENANVSSMEKAYLQIEVIPMLQSFFNSAVLARRWHFGTARQVTVLGVLVAVGSMASATELIAPDTKWIPLLIVGIVSTLKSAIEVSLQVRQPALDWIAARTAYDLGLAEVINRLTLSASYAGLSEEDAYQLMANRICIAFGNAERRIQERINRFLDSPSEMPCKNDDVKDRNREKDLGANRQVGFCPNDD
jgi:hypothetical protein